MKIFFLVLSLLVIFSCGSSQSTKSKPAESTTSTDKPDNAEISEALKGALKIGVEKSTDELRKSEVNTNAIPKIDTPNAITRVVDNASNSGNKEEVEDLQNSVNESIKGIVDAAKDLFLAAINDINFRDAYRILMGGKNAATRYLEENFGSQIENELGPKIEKSLTATGALTKWNTLVNQYQKATGETINFNLVDYVNKQVTGNLFEELGKKEAEFRINQYLWTNVVFKNVFGLQKEAYFNKR